MKTLLITALLLTAIPAYSQTFCSTSRNGNSTTCVGENNEMTIIQRNGRDRDNDRNQPYYGNSTILDDRKPDWERQSEERRREMIYGDDRRERDSSRSRSRYDEER